MYSNLGATNYFEVHVKKAELVGTPAGNSDEGGGGIPKMFEGGVGLVLLLAVVGLGVTYYVTRKPKM